MRLEFRLLLPRLKATTTTTRIPSALWWQTGWPRLAIAGAAVLIIGLRKHDSLIHPQFYGEDGSLFFVEAAAHPWKAILEPYAGYLHLLPRLIAILGSALPVLWVPGFYAWCSLVVAGTVAWTVLSPRVCLPCAWAAPLALAAVPNSGEVYLNLCTLQFTLAVGLLAFVATEDPSSPAQKWGDVLWLLTLELTGPFGVLFVPLFVWRVWSRPSRWSFGFLALALGGAALQWWHLRGLLGPAAPYFWTALHEIAGMTPRFFLLGLPVSARDHEVLFAVLGLALALFFAGLCWQRRRTVPDAWILLAGSLAVLLSSWYKCYHYNWDLADAANGDRYFFPERVFLIWLGTILAYSSGIGVRRTAAALALVVLLADSPQFVYPAAPNLDWPLYSGPIQRGVPTRAPILPVGWYLVYPGRPRPAPAPLSP